MNRAEPRTETLESVLQNVTSKQKVANAEAVEASNEILQTAEPKLTELTQPDAYREHVTSFLADAVADVESGERESVCDCSRPTCPIKQGKIPPRAEGYDDLQEGLRVFRREHIGDAIVLQEARREYMDAVGEVRSIATQAVVALDAKDPWEVAVAAGVDVDSETAGAEA